MQEIKQLLAVLRRFAIWLTPFVLFLALISIFALSVFNLKQNGIFDQYIEVLRIVVWPVTILIALFFFRKVVTYLFFSMDHFDFFGIEGSLKNVNDLIREEVNKQQAFEKAERKRKKELKELSKKLENKTSSAEEYSKLAKEILDAYKKYVDDIDVVVNKLNTENKDLRDRLSGISQLDGPVQPIASESNLGQGGGTKEAENENAQPPK